jgi:hypothetical protein
MSQCRLCDNEAVTALYCEAHRQEMRRYDKRRREERKNRGICANCINPVGPKSQVYCETHRVYIKKNRKPEPTLILDGALAIIFGRRRVRRDVIKEVRKELKKFSRSVKLSGRERFVFDARMKPITLREIGEKMGGITRERVRQIEVRVGKKIQKELLSTNKLRVSTLKIRRRCQQKRR